MQFCCDRFEEVRIPQIQRSFIPDKMPYVFFCRSIIDLIKFFIEHIFKDTEIEAIVRRKRTGSNQPLLQMWKVDSNIAGKIEHIII